MNPKNVGSNLEKTYYQLTLERDPNYYKDKRAKAKEFRSRFGKGIKIPENTVEVVFDPDEVGGFPKGSKIGNLAETLAVGSMTENTIVKYKDQKYQVVGLVGQQLRPLE